MDKKEIEKVVKNYFGDARYTVDVCMLAGIANVSIEYVDFKPKNTVIRELIELVPNIDFGNIERSYSDEALAGEVKDMYGEELTMWVEDDPGKLRKVDFGMFVEERLSRKDIR